MTGIIFTKVDNGYSGALDYNELFSYAKGIPGVDRGGMMDRGTRGRG